MATIEALMRNLSSLDFTKVMEQSIGDTKEEFKNYQQQQMFYGKRSDGENIQRLDGRYEVYAPLTEYFKRRKGQPIDRVTLRDERDFYKGIVIKPTKNSVMITSSDFKTAKLVGQYGENIFGLNKDFAGEYAVNDMGPAATKKIIQQIHK